MRFVRKLFKVERAIRAFILNKLVEKFKHKRVTQRQGQKNKLKYSL